MPTKCRESLCLTANSSFFLLFSLLNVLLSSFLAGIYSLPVEVVEHVPVVSLWLLVDLAGQDAGERFYLFFSEFSSLWHDDFEVNDEVAEVGVRLVEWHSKPPDYFPRLVSHDLSSGAVDVEDVAIEVFQLEFKTNEGFSEGDGLLHEEISSLPGEHSVRFLLDNKNEITGERVGLSQQESTY